MSHFNVNVARVRNWVDFLRNFEIISPGFICLILSFKRMADFPWIAIWKSNKMLSTLNEKAIMTNIITSKLRQPYCDSDLYTD